MGISRARKCYSPLPQRSKLDEELLPLAGPDSRPLAVFQESVKMFICYPSLVRESSRCKVTARNPANFSDSWVLFLIRDVLVRRWMSAAPLRGFITCGGAITIHKVNRFLFLYTWLILRCSLHG